MWEGVRRDHEMMFRCARGGKDEQETETASICKSHSVIVDLVSLFTVGCLDAFHILREMFDTIHVGQSTLDELNKIADQTKIFGETRIGKIRDAEQYVVQKESAEENQTKKHLILR